MKALHRRKNIAVSRNIRAPRRKTNIPNHQHTAKRILANLRVHKLEGEVDVGGLLILDPFVQVAGGEDDVIEQPTALGNLGLESRLVQVEGTGLDDLLLVVLEPARVSIG